MTYVPKPFPKMVYLDGDSAKEWRIVEDEEGLEDARNAGFTPAGEPEDEPEKRRRGRPRKEEE